MQNRPISKNDETTEKRLARLKKEARNIGEDGGSRYAYWVIHHGSRFMEGKPEPKGCEELQSAFRKEKLRGKGMDEKTKKRLLREIHRGFCEGERRAVHDHETSGLF